MRAISFITILLIIVLIGCQEEGQEVKQQFTKDQVRTLIASDGSKFWELKSTATADFEPCIDGEIYIFAKTASDTGIVYVTEPFIDCTEGFNYERDTINTYRWTLTDSESEIFDNQLFILFDDENTTNYLVNKVNPLSLELENSDNINEIIILEELIEEGKPATKDEIRSFLSASGDKFWQITSDNTTDFELCSDGNVYIFSLDETDTGFVYITEPLLDCDGETIVGRDTLETFQWTLTDSESALFDDRLYFFDDAGVTIYNVNEIDDTILKLQDPNSGDDKILNLESL